MRLSLAFRTPINVLQRTMTTREFAELIAWDRHETLDPDGWLQTFTSLSHLVRTEGGKALPASAVFPTTPWPSED